MIFRRIYSYCIRQTRAHNINIKHNRIYVRATYKLRCIHLYEFVFEWVFFLLFFFINFYLYSYYRRWAYKPNRPINTIAALIEPNNNKWHVIVSDLVYVMYTNNIIRNNTRTGRKTCPVTVFNLVYFEFFSFFSSRVGRQPSRNSRRTLRISLHPFPIVSLTKSFQSCEIFTRIRIVFRVEKRNQ